MHGRYGRRQFLRAVAAGGAAAALDRVFSNFASAATLPLGRTPYGELLAREPLDGGTPLLALPPGFVYRVLSEGSAAMSDGNVRPKNFDGMAAFEERGFIRLIRNHERKLPGTAMTADLDTFDSRGAGGTTTLVVDRVTRRVVREFASLSGTVANCGGGPTPWNTWISCEETIVGVESGFHRRHGYCFEVAASSDRTVEPIPLRAMGRFIHEAVAVSATGQFAYMTEDEGDAGFYRFVANSPRNFAAGGRLQMLAIYGRPNYDTARGQVVGRTLPVMWVDIANPDPADLVPGMRSVYLQGYALGGARFRRLEGAATDGRRVYFAATAGGDQRLGQIWRYSPDITIPFRRRTIGKGPQIEGELTLLYESSDPVILKMPDNLWVTPRGALLMCEDAGDGAQYLRCLTPSGEVFDFARNVAPGMEDSELCGVTFSPDGATLFLNIYGVAATIAIWGDWERGPM